MSGSGSGGTNKVPISAPVENQGASRYNNQNCTSYELQISATNGVELTVTLTPADGTYLDLTSVVVPSTGSVGVHSYVPNTITGAYVTASATGYQNLNIPVGS